MTKHITIELTDAEEAQLKVMAERDSTSMESLVGELVRRTVDYDARFIAEVQKAIDSANRGELTPHDEVMAEMRELCAELRARKAKA